VKKSWPEIVGALIAWTIMAPLLIQIWRNAHWSVALMLTALYFQWSIEQLSTRIRQLRQKS
jgi:hypothetical protein